MFENVGYGEILVLLVAGLFILGPERLPEAAAWLARTLRQVKDFATGARDQLRNELGPDLEEFRKPMEELREPLAQLRGLRNYDPRRAVTRAIFDEPPVKPNGYTPSRDGFAGSGSERGASAGGGSAGAGSAGGGSAGAGSAGDASARDGSQLSGPPPGGPARMHPAAEPPRRLTAGERPPIDPDAT